ncbi:hypothetical protein TNCV_529401 [Trichonephila clavipes]|nr:hypothetical protein TNCV_529401 [Trichonephila clavipes]
MRMREIRESVIMHLFDEKATMQSPKPSPSDCFPLVPAFICHASLPTMSATPSSVTARYGVEESAKTPVKSKRSKNKGKPKQALHSQSSNVKISSLDR